MTDVPPPVPDSEDEAPDGTEHPVTEEAEQEQFLVPEEAPEPANQALDAAADAEQTAAGPDPWSAEVIEYLVRLAQHLEKRGKSTHSVTVPMGRARLLISPLEQDLVFAAAEGRPAKNRLNELVRDAIGIRVKTVGDLRSYAKAANGAERFKVKKVINRDAEHSQLLAYEMHVEISKLSQSGALEDAQLYSEYRRSLLDVAKHATEFVAGDPNQAVLPDGLIGSTIQTTKASSQDYDQAAAEKARRSAEARAKKTRGADPMTKRLQIAALVVLLGVLIAILAYMWSIRPRELEHFQMQDFADVPAVIEVIHREPQLILVVDQLAWNELTSEERLNAVQTAVDSAVVAGYRNVEFRSHTHGTMASWTKGKEILLP